MEFIELYGVRQNNLKNIDVKFPVNQISVVTGLSGSGKSSLAFETLYGEGQRRYVESLSTYVRQFLNQMPRPDLDSINQIPPAIALEQKNNVTGSRSTVGSLTEISDYSRILFAKAGTLICPETGGPVVDHNPSNIVRFLEQDYLDQKGFVLFKSTKPDWKNNLARFFAMGFSRALIFEKDHYEPKTLGDETLKQTAKWKTHPPYIVVDRLVLNQTIFSENISRLIDAIEQASREGHGEISFYFPDKEKDKQWLHLKSGLRSINTGKIIERPTPAMLSFNSPLGACEHCRGFGYNLEIDEKLVIPNENLSIEEGALDPLEKPSLADWHDDLIAFCRRKRISLTKPWKEISLEHKTLIWKGDSYFLGITGIFEELKRIKYKLHVRVFVRRYQTQRLCSVCEGSRLKEHARSLKIDTKDFSQIDITNFQKMTIEQALLAIEGMIFEKENEDISKEPIHQIQTRLDFLNRVGLGYLTLDRMAKTLSGGEFQRINLAGQLGAKLCGTLYVLDEPSIGLHSRDTNRLIEVLKDLRDNGNTVVVVEHDPEMIEHSDWVVELGPLAGNEGGNLIFQGTQSDFFGSDILTARMLQEVKKRKKISISPPKERKPFSSIQGSFFEVLGAFQNNLKNFDLRVPSSRFVGVCGISGSGKSTLVKSVIYENLSKILKDGIYDLQGVHQIKGYEKLSDVFLLDQKPIGKSSRSNPVTFIKGYDEIRKIFASQSTAIRNGFKPSHFSFNVDGGRCPECRGEGEITVDMHFLADVKVPCEVCKGERFQKKVLNIKYKGKSISEVLQMTVNEGLQHFSESSQVVHKLTLLKRVGLGYLKLGQSGTTLSGGESQRLKIAGALDHKSALGQLYIFDEPTTGLHMSDVHVLLEILRELVQEGASVIMIEHNLEALFECDWLIELGPDGGEKGGGLVDSGTPFDLAARQIGPTGKALALYGEKV